MARSPRTVVPPAPDTPGAPASVTAPGPASATRVSRRRQSVSASTSTTPSTPFTPGPLTPADPATPFSGFTPAEAGSSKGYAQTPNGYIPRQSIERKSHALRSVEIAAERTPCPYPSEYGGREKCGVSEEDEADPILMAICGACALMGNRALSPEELARISVENGWIRPPSAAVEPATPINASIRSHMKRCEKSRPPRPFLLAKHQLAGSVAESILESALHPGAFEAAIRPKGTVYYLSAVGKTKWKNPFAGIDIPKVPPKKPGPPKKAVQEKAKDKRTKEERAKGKTKIAPAAEPPASAAPPVKLRLVFNPEIAAAKQKEKEAEDLRAVDGKAAGNEDAAGVSTMPAEAANVESADMTPTASTSTAFRASPLSAQPATLPSRRAPRRPSRPFDSSDDSDTSDSEIEESNSLRVTKTGKPLRRPAPLPIATSGSPRFSYLNRLPQASPFKELFFPSSPHAASYPSCSPQPQSSPFPTHSLDNTFWTVRNEQEDKSGFESSSSSSDDEMREPDWGQNSGILIRADDEEQPVWTADEDEAKVKEATDALRVLFPTSSGREDEMETDLPLELNRLDHRTATDASSVAESTSTVAPLPLRKGEMAHIPLSTFIPSSSPVPSPVLRVATLLPLETSPTQHLTRLQTPLDETSMDIDQDMTWFDEDGEGPVRADPDESLSDSEITSQLDDSASPEHDRQRHTAEWALEAAVSTAFGVKAELVDYPSPVNTECDDPSPSGSHEISRASSAETQSPSSASSDISLEGIDFDYDEVVCGPESLSIDEIDGLYESPVEKTPRKKIRCKPSTSAAHRCSGNWGKVGVGGPILVPMTKATSPAKPIKTRSSRPAVRRRKSSPEPIVEMPPTPPAMDNPAETSVPEASPAPDNSTDLIDAIGTAELELAKAEAEARDEERRAASRERAEQKRVLLEAYRQCITDSGSSPEARTINWDQYQQQVSSSDLASAHWGSTDSLQMLHSGAMSPMALHSLSMLSLKDLPTSVDPRALRSPPIGLDGMMGMEEMMAHPALLGMAASAPANLAPKQPMAPFPADSDVAMDGSATNLISPSAHVDSSSAPAMPIPVLPGPAVPATTALDPSLIQNSTTLAPVPAAGASSGPLTGNTSPTTSIASTSTPSTTTASQTATASVTEKDKDHSNIICVPLINGVNISVTSMIPTYVIKVEGPLGLVTAIRRIDTDFVNATSVLLALGIPKSKHEAILRTRGSVFASSREMLPVANPKLGYEEGILGVWVQLSEARMLRAMLVNHADNPVWALLNDDIVEKFNLVIKNSVSTHKAADKTIFGGSFQPARKLSTAEFAPSTSFSSSKATTTPPTSSLPRPASAAPASAPAATAKPKVIPAKKPVSGTIHHRANSTSTTVAATVPARPAPAAKAALVRPANGVPEGCPQAKRRRATVVGTSPVKAMMAPNALTAGAPVPAAVAVAGRPPIAARPPSMVPPVKPAAPAVTVTPVAGVRAQPKAGPLAPALASAGGAVPGGVLTAKSISPNMPPPTLAPAQPATGGAAQPVKPISAPARPAGTPVLAPKPVLPKPTVQPSSTVAKNAVSSAPASVAASAAQAPILATAAAPTAPSPTAAASGARRATRASMSGETGKVA